MKMTDPELYGICERFMKHEVPDEPGQELCGETRYLAILAVLMGSGAPEAFEEVLGEALESGVSPAAVREAVYQATDYLGYGRMLTFLHRANGVFEKRGIKLPLQPQATGGDRLERGIDAQARIFGEQMREAWKKSHINCWLAENCFGDFYTRTGLDIPQREMITFCFLMAQGGCEPQLAAHICGNFHVGNDADLLRRVVSQCLPYIGYPRSLNALRCIDEAAGKL